MTVGELVTQLQQYDASKEIELDSYEADEYYDWDENLSWEYTDITVPPKIIERGNRLAIVAGGVIDDE